MRQILNADWSEVDLSFLKKNMVWDDRLIEHGMRAGSAYFIRGRRMHGSDIAPAVRHIGNKMAQVGRYGHTAAAAFRLGKRAINYLFSKNKKQKTMPPARSRSTSSMSVVPRTPSQSPRGTRSRTRSSMQTPAATPRRRASGRSVSYSAVQRTNRAPRRRLIVKAVGAKTSMSAGKFSKGTSSLGKFDLYARKGFVVTYEAGGVLQCSATETAGAVGHATHNMATMIRDIGYAMSKFVAQYFNHDVQSVTDVISPVGSRAATIQLLVQEGLGGAAVPYNFTLTAGKTFDDLFGFFVGAIYNMLDTTTASYIFKTLSGFWNVEGAVGSQKIFNLDLQKAKIHSIVKSDLKIQNRTVSEALNNDAEDVDNVPVYGKSYLGNGNYFRVGKDYPFFTQNYVDTTAIVAKFAADTSGSEPYLKSQVVGCKSIGKAHLDPGQIKTSTLYHEESTSLNLLLQILIRGRFNVSTNPQFGALISKGKIQVFHLEKMIQAVATTAVNGIKLAWEVNAKRGAYMTCPKQQSSLMYVKNTPA